MTSSHTEIEAYKRTIALLQWRAEYAQRFLDGYSAAPNAAKEVLNGGYDDQFEAQSDETKTLEK